MYHEPILVKAFLSFFEGKEIGTFVDGTVGAGGHAAALLEAHPEVECFYGLDRDPGALEIARERLNPFGEKVHLIHGNYRDLDELIAEPSVDGMFLDLGVSSMQLDCPEKGFSFMKEGPLDMRMDPTQELTAESVVNSYSEKDLAQIFFEYGEESRARVVARTLVQARRKRRLTTTRELTEALKHVLTWSGRRRKKLHPMTLIFQALRIEVNDELGGIKEVLPKAISLLAPGGRLGVIAFHALEDRLVKFAFKESPEVEVLTKKPLEADEEEKRRNPRSRSAKMRFVEKVRQ